MNNQNFEQKAIRLVSVTQQGKYVVNPDGANFLSKIQKPIGVVSVAGLYRTGKSYLLNRMLLNKSSGFGVGSTINACTKGLWCWGTPIKGTTPDGQKINVVIIDSQGIGALDEDQNHDTKVFTLAVLSASTFIYNSVGSIDQNALQNLSLVVNLSKNIQINSNSQEEQVDPQELSQYFPNFCWIVRDFSLQLINGNGDTITPNQYLQRALALQKGFSDDIEDKNRIRRLLTAFFKNRDCITLVRPLVNQTKLQQLQKLQLEELRPQFVEQVLQLRKKILFRLNPKKIKGQLLDGKMYLNTLTSYVAAINQGAVPNMQNAWSYMCQQKCLLTFDDCIQQLEKQLQQLQQTVPHENEGLNKVCQQLQENLLKKYLQETKGMQKQAKQQFIELKTKIKSSIKEMKKKNEKQSLTLLKSYAFKNFQSIQKMMATGQFSKYQDYIKQLNLFYTSLLETGPNLPNKQLVFLDFIKKAAIQGAQLFLKSLYKSMQNKKSIYQEQKTQLMRKTQQMRQQLSKQLLTKKQQLQQMDQQNTQLLSNLQSCKHQLQSIRQKQMAQQKQHKQQLQKRKQHYQKQTKELLFQISEIKNLLKQIQKQKYQLQKQLQKTKALYELKQQQLEQQLSEYKKKDEMNVAEMLRMRLQMQNKYENRVKEIQNKMQTYKKKCENQILIKQSMKQKVQQLEHTLQDEMKEVQRMKETHEEEIQELNTLHQSQVAKLNEEIKALSLQIQQSMLQNNVSENNIKQQLHEKQKLTQQLSEKLNAQTISFKKQKAIYQQKISFLEMELKQLDETHKSNSEFYQNRIIELQELNKNISANFNEEKLREVKNDYQTKIKSIQKMFEEEKYKLSTQVEILTKQKQKFKFDLEMQQKSKENQISKYTNVISTIQQQLNLIKSRNTSEQSSIREQYQTKTSELQYRLKQLQIQLENAKQQAQNFQTQGNNRSQQAIMQLKNYYELQKQKLQQKFIKEKQKYEKKLLQVTQQFDQKLKQQTGSLEQEYQFLKEEYMTYQMQVKQTMSMLQHDLDLKTKAYDSLQQQYTEQKVFYQKKEIQLAQKNQFLTQQLNEERTSLQKKIDQLLKERTKIEKQLITVAHQKEEVSILTKTKDQKIAFTQSQLVQLHKQIDQLKASSRQKQSEVQSQFMQKIINYEKKIALNMQENDFLVKKNGQLEKYLQTKTKSYQQKIQVMKEQTQALAKMQQEKRIKETQDLQQKYQKLKKSSKQTEVLNNKKISGMQRQLAIQKQKCINFQTRLNEHKSTNHSLQEKLNSQLSVLKQSFNQQKSSLVQKIETLRQNISHVESQKQSQTSQYQKQSILLKNQIKYLQETKQKSKKQYMQKMRRVQQLLGKSQKEKKQQKSFYENTLNQNIKKIQKKNQDELKQSNALYQKRQSQYQQRINALQSQNRALSQKLSSSTYSNSQNHILQQRRLTELQESEKRLLKQLESLKSQKKQMSSDTFILYEKQKEQLKAKLSQKQQKLRQSQKLKQEYFYQLQKQKAKQNVEKQSFVMKIEELKEQVSKYERELQKYQRQNQKLKVQKRSSMSKVNLGRYSVNKSQFGLNNNFTQRSGLQQSMSFLNVSVTSSIRGQTTNASNKQGRSFSKMNKQYLKTYKNSSNSNMLLGHNAQSNLTNNSKQNSQKYSEKLSERLSQKQRDKQNFNPILDEESFFGGYE